jgi:hypothetical protein
VLVVFREFVGVSVVLIFPSVLKFAPSFTGAAG